MTARMIVLTIMSLVLAAGVNAAPGLAPVSIASMEALEWIEAAPGVWSARIGGEDAPSFDDFAGGTPQADALGQVGPAEFPFPDGAVRGEVRGGRVSIRLPLSGDEQIYGLGLQFRGINRRGEVWHLRMDHYGGVPGRTHAPVPFYVSSEGYGVLFNTTRWISVYPGIGNRKGSDLPPIRDRNADREWQARPASDAVEATATGTGMEVLVFAGQSPLDAVRRYNLYFGGGALPPRWGLGFWHRVPTHAKAEQVIAEAGQFEKQDFPLDVIGLEPGWQSKAYPGTFDWDTGRFPDPAGFVSAMSSRNLKVNLWENPYLSPDSSIYDAMEPYTGSHMVWLGLVPDYTLAEARVLLTEHHTKTHLDIGVSGYKIDEVDGVDAWLWPDHATFPSGTTGEVMRQTYGLQLQQMLTGIFRARNTRTYGLVRGSNAGASAYPWAIYSDYYDHRGYIAALCNSGFAGVLWTPEIRSAGSDKEWVRRMQTVCFSPMAILNAWASGMKPWSKPKVTGIIRDTMKWRIRFLPYLGLLATFAVSKVEFEGQEPTAASSVGIGAAAGVDLQFLPTDTSLAAVASPEFSYLYVFGEAHGKDFWAHMSELSTDFGVAGITEDKEFLMYLKALRVGIRPGETDPSKFMFVTSYPTLGVGWLGDAE